MAIPCVRLVVALWVQKELADGRELRSDILRARIQGRATVKRLPPNSKVDHIGVGLVQAP